LDKLTALTFDETLDAGLDLPIKGSIKPMHACDPCNGNTYELVADDGDENKEENVVFFEIGKSGADSFTCEELVESMEDPERLDARHFRNTLWCPVARRRPRLFGRKRWPSGWMGWAHDE
jgi:hypothetical protein